MLGLLAWFEGQETSLAVDRTHARGFLAALCAGDAPRTGTLFADVVRRSLQLAPSGGACGGDWKVVRDAVCRLAGLHRDESPASPLIVGQDQLAAPKLSLSADAEPLLVTRATPLAAVLI